MLRGNNDPRCGRSVGGIDRNGLPRPAWLAERGRKDPCSRSAHRRGTGLRHLPERVALGFRPDRKHRGRHSVHRSVVLLHGPFWRGRCSAHRRHGPAVDLYRRPQQFPATITRRTTSEATSRWHVDHRGAAGRPTITGSHRFGHANVDDRVDRGGRSQCDHRRCCRRPISHAAPNQSWAHAHRNHLRISITDPLHR